MSKHPPTRPIDFQYEAALLSEECGEVVQIIGKSFRFGWNSYNPVNGEKNLDLLHDEVGDILAAADFAAERGLLDEDRLAKRRREKLDRLRVIAPSSMLALDHEVEDKEPEDEGLSAKQERIALGVGTIFLIVALLAVWFGSSWYTAQETRLQASQAATACYAQATATNTPTSPCDALQTLSKR